MAPRNAQTAVPAPLAIGEVDGNADDGSPSANGDEESEFIESGAFLDLNHRKARYGVAYLRDICFQAGVALGEVGPDEDVLAIDCEVRFPQLSVRVQVKCTSKWTIGGRSLTFPVEERWVQNWDKNAVPTYFVVVLVPDAVAHYWIDHKPTGTFHRTAAFWCRLLPGEVGSSVEVPKSQRLTNQSISRWHQDVLEMAGVLRSGK